MLVFPALDSHLISLAGLLHTVLDGTQNSAAMRRVIAHPKLALNHLCYSLRRPHLSPKAKRLGTTVQQTWQLGQLLGAQLGLRPRRRVPAQGFDSSFSPSFEPLTHCSLSDPQGRCNIFLFPALLLQFPGASAAPFFPIFLLLLVLHLSILLPLTTCAAVSKGCTKRPVEALEEHQTRWENMVK